MFSRAIFGSRRPFIALLVFFITTTLFLILVPPSPAAVQTVSNTNNSGAGSLRQALVDASPGDVIDATGVTGVISPASVLIISKNLTINGPVAGQLAVDGSRTHRVFEILGNLDVDIHNLTIQNGYAVSGGGFYINPGSTVDFERVRFLDNQGLYYGGALNIDANTTVGFKECLFSGNWLEGGSYRYGGGIYISSGNITIDDSTFTANSAEMGGALYLHQSQAAINNSTISGNQADYGGGIYVSRSNLTHSTGNTISGNQADYGGGIFLYSSDFNLTGTILAENTADNGPDWDCSMGTPLSYGNNLIGNTDGCNFVGHTGDIVQTDALLGPLEDNGGPTPTHALLTGSPAIDRGQVGLRTVDQRGVASPQNGRADVGPAYPDMGAFELESHGLWVTIAGDGDGRVVSDPAGIDCGDRCHEGFRISSTVGLTAEPSSWSRFDGFSEDCSGAGPCNLTMDGDHAVTATFSKEYYSIQAEAGTGGSIDPQGLLYLPGGGDQTFTVSPSNAYIIQDVEVDGTSQGRIFKHTLKQIQADHSIQAYFQAKPDPNRYYLLAQALEGGTIDPDGYVDAAAGASRTFNITPSTGYRIADLEVDGQSAGAQSQRTFSNLDDDHTILASFVPVGIITATAETGGSLSPSGSVEVDFGENQLFRITPQSGYFIKDVAVDGSSVGPVPVYEFLALDGDHTIRAVFDVIASGVYTIDAVARSEKHGSITPAGQVYVNGGIDQAFQITARRGCRLIDLTVDGQVQSPADQYTFSSVNDHHTITATFAQIHRIKPTYGSHGHLNPDDVVEVIDGTDQTFTVEPDTGWYVQDVVVDGVSIGRADSYTFSNVKQNHTIQATFDNTLPIYYLQVSAIPTEGGLVTPMGTVAVVRGDTRQVTIAPNEGYVIDDVMVDGESQGAISSYSFTNVTRNHTLTASFSANPSATHYIYTYASPSLYGSVNPAGKTAVNEGDDQEVTITPHEGYAITDVIVDGESKGALTTLTFENVTSDHTLTAMFDHEPLTITAQAGSGGRIEPNGPVPVEYGQNKTFTIIPDYGCTIQDVLVDGESQGPMETYTFSNVQTDHAITAAFEYNNVTIFSSATTGGTITPSGEVDVRYGDDQTFMITPETGYHIKEVLTDTHSLGQVSQHTFEGVVTGHTIHAVFEENQEDVLTINAMSFGSGTIEPEGNIFVSRGEDRLFTISPNQGDAIIQVYVDTVAQGPLTEYTFQDVTANHYIIAEFTSKTLTIEARAGENGVISPSGSLPVDYNTNQEFIISPHEGHYIQSVTVDGTDLGPLHYLLFENVIEDHVVEAGFSSNPEGENVINAIAESNGSITPSGNVFVARGGSITFYIEPADGYEIRTVYMDGEIMSSVDSFKFEDVTSNHSIRASFKTSQSNDNTSSAPAACFISIMP